MVDPRRYETNYVPEFRQFREIQKEPTPFRSSINCVIKLDHEVIYEFCGSSFQAGSLAAFAQYDTEVPFEAIAEVTDYVGWVIFDKPMHAGGNSSQASSSVLPEPSDDLKCPTCRRSQTLGLVYCLWCWVPLPGATEKNVFEDSPVTLVENSSNRTATDAENVNKDAGGNSSQPSARPGDTTVAALLASVKLSIVQETARRSYTKRSEMQAMYPDKAFSDYCKEILQRIKRPTGIKMEEGEICHFDKFPSGKMFRARAERDQRFRDQLRKAMREVYPTCIGDIVSIEDYDGLLSWADHMKEHAIKNKESIVKFGNPNPKSSAQRANAPPKYKVASGGSAQDAAGNSIPLNTVAGYDTLRRQAELQSTQARVQTAYRQAPSDGYGCNICGGNHYARDCYYRDRGRGYGPY